ncbi:MAG TPA: holo-ACP synthase [Longimicrobium sp.]|nr:holo-ACP synthase [Longimicrobium sp.]
MIVGVGIDMVRIERVAALLERKGDRALRRLFTEGETRRCRESRHPAESFAARFAAKEAFFKALGTGVGPGGEWTEVEVESLPSGAPRVSLTGRAAETAAALGVARVHLSLTHAEESAAAVVVLEG